MAIKINLYHEVLRARHEEQYDPLRLSMIGLVVIVIGLAAYYGIALVGRNSVQNALRQKQMEYDQLQPKVKVATEEEKVLSAELGLADQVNRRIEDRFYWGPVFEHLVSVVPANVQITRCNGDVAPDPGRRCQITVEGIAAGEEPRRVAEDLRVRLLERLGGPYKNVTAVFRNLEDGNEKIAIGGTPMPTAHFNIGINFISKATPEPTPVPRKTARRLAQQEQ
jgi:Tfp pilus assembly protein PilN